MKEVTLVLNQRSRPDRWEQALMECRRIGIEPVQFFSIDAEQPYQSFCLSQKAMLEHFLTTDGDLLLALEDDIEFRDLGHYASAIGELPEDWDMLYLGANVLEERPEYYSENLRRIRAAWTTHAIRYTRKAVEFIVSNYRAETFQMYDDWLREYVLPVKKCYIVCPMVAWQRPGRSDLWGQMVDYTGAWIDSDRRMKA